MAHSNKSYRLLSTIPHNQSTSPTPPPSHDTPTLGPGPKLQACIWSVQPKRNPQTHRGGRNYYNLPLIDVTVRLERCTVIPVFWSGVLAHFGNFGAPWFWYSFASKSQANRPKMNLVPVRAQHIVSANFVLTQSAKCTQSLITVPELVGFGLTASPFCVCLLRN